MPSLGDRTHGPQEHEERRRTPSGYEIAVGLWPLTAQPEPAVPFIAVVGRSGLSLEAVVFAEVLAWMRTADTSAVCAAVLLYLATTGRPCADGRPVRFPRPDALGRVQLKNFALVIDGPTLQKRVDWNALGVSAKRQRSLIEELRHIAAIAERNIVTEHSEAASPSGARAVKKVERVLQDWWIAKPSKRPDLFRVLQPLVSGYSSDSEQQAALLSQAELGRQLYHWAIQHHQQRALAEATALRVDPRVDTALIEGTGIHHLLYDSWSTLGAESWSCCLTASGRVRVVMPQLVWYGRHQLGERWLRTLVAAFARRDEALQRKAIAALAPVVVDVAKYRYVGPVERSLFAPRRTRQGVESGYVELDVELDVDSDEDQRPRIVAQHDASVSEELDARLLAHELLARRGELSQPEAELLAALVADPDLTRAEYAQSHDLPWSTVDDTFKRLRRKLGRKAS